MFWDRLLVDPAVSWNKYEGWGLPSADNVSSICRCEPPLADTLYLARVPHHVVGGPLTRIMGFILFRTGKRGLAEAAHSNLRVCILAAQKSLRFSLRWGFFLFFFLRTEKLEWPPKCGRNHWWQQMVRSAGAQTYQYNNTSRQPCGLNIWKQSLLPWDCADCAFFFFFLHHVCWTKINHQKNKWGTLSCHTTILRENTPSLN